MKRSVVWVATAVAVLGGSVWLKAQGPARRPLTEEVYKNIQVMRGVPADELLVSMGVMSNALAVNCTYCHLGDGGGGWAEYGRDNDKKVTARRMVLMMNQINQTHFGGRQVVTCISCHNGGNRPRVTANLAAYYSAPTSDEPETIRQAPGSPTADQVLDKYIQAIGGSQRVSALTSVTARGTYLGYGDADKVPVEIWAKANPRQRSIVITTPSGKMTTNYDGRTGWLAVPEAFSPLTVREFGASELDGAKLDADLMFPANIKQALQSWQGAIPAAMGDKDVVVIQGQTASGSPVRLYFDDETGFLVRTIRFVNTPIGRATRQTDYSDYRDVAGVKVPFHLDIFQESGAGVLELTSVQPNASVDASRFAKPAP
ncbi:MAG: photosynthetic reaction center cytochrome c subunit family protein [Vicinamibacterales bacterium]